MHRIAAIRWSIARRLTASHFCSKMVALSAPTKRESAKHWPRPTLYPDWVAGISIGGINGAIIAGNPREVRVAKPREFWELVSCSAFGFDVDLSSPRSLTQKMNVSVATWIGVPDFYGARIPNVWFQPAGTIGATSCYDMTVLKTTLERVVDFDLINSEKHDVRLSLGSVNVRSGKLVYFDSADRHYPGRVCDGERRAAAGISAY
jgi:predicted acylesterase/phospholipase RssA